MNKEPTIPELLSELPSGHRSKVDSLLERIQRDETLPLEEQAFLCWLASFYRQRDLTRPKIEPALERFRTQRDKRLRKRGTKAAEQVSNNKKQTPLQRDRRAVRAEAQAAYSAMLADCCQPMAIAEEHCSPAFLMAFPDLIEAFFDEVVRVSAVSLADREMSTRERLAGFTGKRTKAQEQLRPGVTKLSDVSFERVLSETDEQRLLRRFVQQLERHQEQAVQRYKLQTKIRSLWSYYEGAFRKEWDAVEQTCREQCIELGIDGESIFSYYRDETLQIARRYQGLTAESVVRERLQTCLQELRQATEHRVAEEQQFQALLSRYEAHSDFSNCFPVARGIKRQIEFYCGPTNSGKTHAAMNVLASGGSGVYLAPLRLLALEGQENLQSRGVKASFLTGEERDEVEGATFVSSTIEMLDYDKVIDTAVIDEIQLIGDPQRGWAWTNALIGVPAKLILLTGSPDALPVVQRIADSLGEPLFVREFQRFNPLQVQSEASSLKKEDIHKLEPGTAIICFSRRDVLEIKQHIEANTQKRVSVIYGSLAPEVRRQEARRFRDREADILVATDAISMGLNLPVRTVLFWRTYKKYGGETHPLRPTEIKQIAGRAGRYGLEDRGYVGAFDEEDIERVNEALSTELHPLSGPCSVMPLPFHISLLSEVLYTDDLVHILRFFSEHIWFSRELFVPMVTEDMLMLARMLEEQVDELTLTEKYTFACAPVNMRAKEVVRMHLSFARQLEEFGDVELPTIEQPFQRGVAGSLSKLRDAEDAVMIATLYQWLGFRFPGAFLHMKEAREARDIINRYISRSLERGRLERRCTRCQCTLPIGFTFNVCETCFSKRRKRRRY
jgi:ATP-dependent RNA helicase SUPV3L1/SUV3